METYIIRGRQYNVTRHYGNYEPVFAISPDGKEVRVVAQTALRGWISLLRWCWTCCLNIYPPAAE